MSGVPCIVDCETTGLNPERHAIWEIGLITPDGAEHQWLLSLTVEQMRASDAIALNIGRFHERHPQGNAYVYTDDAPAYLSKPEAAIAEVLHLTHGCHLAGAVVSFDEERLRLLALDHGMRPSWHYHLIDVEALAAGWLVGSFTAIQEVGKNSESDGPSLDEVTQAWPPWDSNALSRAVGVDPDDYERHTAIGDCRWARAIWRNVMGDIGP